MEPALDLVYQSPHHPPPKFSEGKPSTFFLAAKAQLNTCTFVL